MIISYWDPEQKVIHLFIKLKKKKNYKRRCLSFKKDPTFLYLKVMISSFFFFLYTRGWSDYDIFWCFICLE